MVAPTAPAAAAPTPSSRRRVTLPLYHMSFAHASCVQFSAMCFLLVDLGRGLRGRPQGAGEDLQGPLDLGVAVGERHVELLRSLDDAAPDHLVGERRVPVA